MGNLANLTRLGLGGNQLRGEIPPELGNLANLERLNLNDNQLTGQIPPELGNLANLTVLDLNDNQLTGEIPSELYSLANLRSSLEFTGNQLTYPDRETLIALYHATDGPNWIRQTNWLTSARIDQWDGVQADRAGRITRFC